MSKTLGKLAMLANGDNCALWDAIGKYAEANSDFMHASHTQIEKNTRAGSSLYVALENARKELEALIGKRDSVAG